MEIGQEAAVESDCGVLLSTWCANRERVCERTVQVLTDSKLISLLTWIVEYTPILNTVRTGLLNCLNARSRGLSFRHRASCI